MTYAPPVVYRPGKFGLHYGRCGLCGVEMGGLVTDHCHRHNLVRGSLCGSCNYWMGRHDKAECHMIPVEGPLTAECQWAMNCRECFLLRLLIPRGLAILSFIALTLDR
jgi:hypothetical protein